MLCVIRLAFHHPVPRFHRAFTTGSVLLGKEGLLVCSDLGEVFATGVHRTCYRRETDACHLLVLRRTGAALHFLSQEQAVTVGVLGGRYTVGSKQHLVARVLPCFTRFTQCAGYRIDTRAPFYMCHLSSAFAEQTVLRTDRPLSLLDRYTERPVCDLKDSCSVLHAVGGKNVNNLGLFNDLVFNEGKRGDMVLTTYI